MSDGAKEAVRRAYSAVNRGDFDALGESMADDVIEHEQMPGLEPTKEGVLQFFRSLKEAFPDLSLTVEDMVAEGDKVSTRVTLSGTHRGEFMGMPATGNGVSVPVADFFRVRDGRIAEHWGVSDLGAMMEQLGADPAA